MSQRNAGLQLLLFVVLLVLAPIWICIPALLGVVLYRHYRSRNEQ